MQKRRGDRMREIMISSTVMILLVMLFRVIFRGKVRHCLIYAMWLFVALRLLVPVNIGTFSFGVSGMMNQVQDHTENTKEIETDKMQEGSLNTLVLHKNTTTNSKMTVPEEKETPAQISAQEKMQEDKVELKGVRFSEEHVSKNLTISTVVIETENGAKAMEKPKGTYITIEALNMDEEDEDYHREISEQLAKVLKQLISVKKEDVSVLIVGLGNRAVTPDALGPRVVDNLYITRHIINEYGKYAFGKEHVNRVSSIVPGVMAQTGMESMEIVNGIVKETKPDVVIAIDALAARNTKRLNRTIQVTDTGINPGSGVGNHRHGLNEKSIGVPVIAIGVPTVVDAATIVNDTMFNLITAMNQSSELKTLGNTLGELNETEKYELIRELLSPNLNTMFVTPKDIDESVKRLSFTISDGLNIALIDHNIFA